jgi:hypothetical protein
LARWLLYLPNGITLIIQKEGAQPVAQEKKTTKMLDMRKIMGTQIKQIREKSAPSKVEGSDTNQPPKTQGDSHFLSFSTPLLIWCASPFLWYSLFFVAQASEAAPIVAPSTAIASLASALSYGEGKKMVRVYLTRTDIIEQVLSLRHICVFWMT